MERMTPEQFCYWLQGFAEMQAAGDMDYMAPDEEQWEMIVEHLQTVFKKVTGGALPIYNGQGGAVPAPFTLPKQTLPDWMKGRLPDMPGGTTISVC